jgi:hypothetical protein
VSLAKVTYEQHDPRAEFTIMLPHQSNGQAYEKLLWSPENPRLVTTTVTVTTSEQRTDVVASYFGIRSVGWWDGHFVLNDRLYYVRAVLEQGYWPDTHLAAPSADALRTEVQLIKDLGFNSARVHEKVEDPRFLFWADRFGLLIWGESASAFEFSPTAVERSTREWTEMIPANQHEDKRTSHSEDKTDARAPDTWTYFWQKRNLVTSTQLPQELHPQGTCCAHCICL